MSDQQDKMLQNYLERVMAIKEQQSKTLTEQELRSIAREVGLSDEDLAAADQAAHQHFQRGLNFYQHRRWDDAVNELQEAVAYAPGWLDYKAQLALAHLERWKQSGREPDRYAAASLARECIDIDPNFEQAYQILNQVDQPQQQQAKQRPQPNYAAAATAAGPQYHHQQRKKSGGGAILIVGALGALSVLTCAGAGMAFFLVGQADHKPPIARPVVDYNDPIPPKPVVSNYKTPKSTYKPSKRGKDLPLNIDMGKYAKSVKLLKQNKSELRTYRTTNTAYYDGAVVLENISDRELTRLNWKIQYIGSNGEPLLTDKKSYMGAFAPSSYRPGDRMTLSIFKKVSPDVTSVNVELEMVKSEKAKKSYPPEKPLKMVANGGADISNLELVEREAPFKTYRSNKTHGYVVPVVKITNKKNRTIKYMKTEFVMIDKGGQVLDRQTWSLVSTTNRLAPGNSSLLKRTFKVPINFDSYRVEVVEVRLED